MAVKEDLRVVRTRKLLCDTLLGMMENQSIEHISVIDVCDKAMVNRATFYKHFDDKYALLSYALVEIKRALYDDFTLKATAADTPQDTIRALFAAIINFLFDNRNRVVNIIRHNMHTKVINGVTGSIADSISFHVAKYSENYAIKVPLPLLANFLAGGLMTTLLWCIENSTPYTYDEFLTCVQIGCMDALFEKI